MPVAGHRARKHSEKSVAEEDLRSVVRALQCPLRT